MERPFLSVIVPTRNRPKQLISCLDAIAGQDYPRGRFEVIVVCDGCAVPSGDRLDRLHEEISLTVLSQPHGGPAIARNNGARGARGEYLLFTDDDCLPMPGWLGELARGFSRHQECALGGRTVNALPLNRYSTASHYLLEYFYAVCNPLPGDARFFASNNMAVPAPLFRAVGGFDEGYGLAAGEDRDFCRKVRQYGNRLVYLPEAVVNHAHDLNLAGFLRQQFNYGRGSCTYHRLAAEQGRAGVSFWPVSAYAGLLAYPLRRAKGPQKLSITLLFLLSQLAVAAGRTRERMKAE